jgi:hypothetical protein
MEPHSTEALLEWSLIECSRRSNQVTAVMSTPPPLGRTPLSVMDVVLTVLVSGGMTMKQSGFGAPPPRTDCVAQGRHGAVR